jgi:site-specific DNA recombinase
MHDFQENAMTLAPSSAADVDTPSVKRSVRLLRVSTTAQTDTDYDEDRQEGNSIDTQRKETVQKEKRLGTVNVGEYVEPGYSGQSIEKRPFFREMMKRIVEQRDVDYVVIYMRSRVFRNYIEAAVVKRQLEALGVKIVSAKEDFGDGYMAEAMEAVTDVFNWLQVKISGQDIKTKMANKARNGGTIGHAKVGYHNQKILIEGHKVNTVVLDPERAPYIRMAFELFATGLETVESLHTKLTEAGFRMPGNAKRPAGPISHERLRMILRDRYYVGYVTYDAIEYEGRHEALVTEELFEQVQSILDAHAGSGTREHTHNHYLKGLLWCARCKHRMMVQRTLARSGEGYYYYFFCSGRRKGLCDLPYIPVEVLEEAVMRYYGQVLATTPEGLAELRAGIDEALDSDHGISDDMREQFARRLEALDKKESYFLDLAAEEGWPKDKLRSKIDAIRQERAAIQHTIERADQRLDLSRQIMYDALTLLAEPQVAYERGSETIRSLLNKAFFTRLYVDGEKIAEHEFKEPFDKLMPVYEQFTFYSAASTVFADDTQTGTMPLVESGARDRENKIGSEPLTWWVSGSTKPSMVGDTGIEPVTSSV